MKYTVLLVDDEPNVLHGICRLLREQPYQLCTARSGEEAIDILKARPIDLIVTDERMPGLQGSELCAWVLKNSPEVARIILTGQASVPAAIRAINEGGVYRFLTKPIDAMQLAMAIRAALEEKENVREERKVIEASKRMLLESTANQQGWQEKLNSIQQEKDGIEQQYLGLEEVHQRLENKAEEKDSFFASMTHELRSPLVALLGSARLLEGDNDSPERREDLLQIIRASGNHLLDLVNNTLDHTKIEAGKMEVEQIACSPIEIAKEVHAIFVQQAEEKELRLLLEIATEVPDSISSDPTRLRQILINLVGNAVKFTTQGSVSIRVELLESADKIPRLQFEVIDTGIGLSAEEQAQLFNEYAQANALVARQYGGSGIGLSVSKKLANLLGGDISITSEQGQGSCFTLTIECLLEKLDTDFSKTTVDNQDSSNQSDSKKITGSILLVEDSKDVQQILSYILRKAGAEVTIAENGKIAVELALSAKNNNEPFDMVLMDVHMPILDGIAATEQLRQSGYEYPIIMCTASTDSNVLTRCTNAGCTAIATKPIDSGNIVQLAQDHIPTAESV